MPKKYSYNGAHFSYDELLEKYGTNDNVQKAIAKFGFKETVENEENKNALLGKPKTVVKKDAVAAVKNTVSKSDPFSSEQQGFDIKDPTGVNKVFDGAAPISKVKTAKPVKPISTEKPKQGLQLMPEYDSKVKKEESEGFFNYLKESFDSTISTISQSFYQAPEYAYDILASATNPIVKTIGKQFGMDIKDTSSETVMEAFGVKNIPAEILQKGIDKSNKVIKEYSSKNGEDPLTAIENGNYLGAAKLTIGSTVQSSPWMAAAILSGGSSAAMAGIAASTAVSKASQLKKENPEINVQERTTNAAVSGLLEGYLGQLFTGVSGAVVKKIIADKGAKVGSKIISNGLIGTLEKAIEKNPVIGILGEVVEESGVELGNQLNDINSGIRKELDTRSIINAGIIATGMAGTNTVPIYAAKGYMKLKDYNQVKAVNKEINGLTNQLSSPYLSDSDKKLITSRVNRLVDENKAIAGASLEKISALPENIKSEINTINTDLDDLKSKYLDIADNFNLPIEAKKAIGDEIKLQAKELDNRKNSIIEGNYMFDDFNKLSDTEQGNFKNEATNFLIKENEKNNDASKPKPEIIDRKAVELYNNQLRIDNAAKEIELVGKLAGTKNVAEIKNGIGENKIVEIFDTPESLQEAYNKYHTDNKLTGEPRDVSEDAGFALGDQIVINKKVAENFREGDSVGRHELLHKILKSSFSEPEAAAKLKNNFLNALSSKERNVIEKRLKDRGYTEQNLIDAPDEYLTQFFEALETKEIEYSDTSFLTMWRSFLQPIYQKLGFRKLDFKSGADVYTFIKDYHKSVSKGELSKRAIALKEKGIDTGIKESSSKVKVAEVQAKIDKLEDQYDNDEIEYDTYENNLKVFNEELKKARLLPEEEAKPKVEKPKVKVTEEDEVKEIIKNERGSIASDKVQKIYETKGVNGAQDIIDLFKPITKKIVDKRRDAPGFDRKLLTDEVETGAGGLLDLIRTYKVSSGVPLAAYINKNLPLRAIASSKRVLDKQFSKDAAEEKGLMATETADERFTETEKEKPKYKNALESKVLEPDVLKTVYNKILTNVRTLKNRIDVPISLNRTITPIIAEIRDAMGKQLDIDLKTAMGGKKDNQLRSFALKNKKYFLENMTTTFLMGADGKGGVPQAVQKQIDGKWTNYPEWVGKKIDREKTTTDNAGRTSGAEMVRRLPNAVNNVSDADYLGQLLEADGNPIRGRKESWAKAMGEEIAFDIINDDLTNGGEIFNALSANQTRLGVEILENLPQEFSKQADRGNVKASKTLNSLPTDLQEYFFDDKNYNKVIGGLTNINAGNFPPSSSYILQVFKTVYDTKKINDDDLLDIADDFSNYLEKFKALPLKKLNSAEEKQFLSDYIKRSAEIDNNSLEGSAENLQKVGNSFLTATEGFKSETALKDMYSVLNGFVSSIKTDKQSLSWYRMLGNFLASQAQIGDDTFVTEEGLLLNTKDPNFVMSKREGGPRKKIDKTTKKEISKAFSYQPFSDKGSFWKFISDAIGEKLPAGYNINEKTNEKDSASALFNKKSNEAYLENKKNTTLANREFLYKLLDFVYDPSNNVSGQTKKMIWASLNSSVESPLRKSGMVKWVFEGEIKGKNKKLVYEHLTSVNKKRFQLHELFKNNNINKKEAFDKLMEDYNVAIIPKIMDNEITSSGFKTESLIGDKSEGSRYYNILTSGIKNIFSLKGLGKNAKQTLGKEFVEFVKKQDYQNAQNLAAVTYSLKQSKIPKGISVFDFDDTVGLTDGSVLYTMPDELMIHHGGSIKDLRGINGALYLATDKNQAEAYAKGNEGSIKSFVIKSKDIANENEVINEINNLELKPKDSNWNVDELSLYELIDPTFDTSLSENNIKKLFASLINKNIRAVQFTDMDIVSLKNTARNIVVIDKNVLKEPKKLNAEEFAKEGSRFLEEGAVFDFSEFSKVVGGKPGPMVEKMKKMIGKFGPDNFFILTARPANAAGPIHEFLSSIGIDIPLKNITGLGNSAAQAKADWMVGKAAEGYNDFYFSDDAIQNVTAVKNALEVLDVKSKIQQARLKFSKTISPEFNKIIEQNTGMEDFKVFSDIVARRRGTGKNRFDFYVPASAADFELLLYRFIGKGALGEEQKKFFDDALLKPYSNGNDLMDAARQSIKKDYKALTDMFPGIKKTIESLTPDGDFTYDQAIRVAMWNEEGVEIPGISQRDSKKLTDLVNADSKLKAFKEGLIITGRQGKGWVTPEDFWDANTIISDLHNLTEGTGRKKFLAEFIDNAEQMFGKWEKGRLVGPNINKVEAVYGTNVREAIEDVLWRMTTGKNRGYGKDKETSAWANWVNGSTGTIMFLNTRSAVLQLIGAVNFLNLRDNNPFAAAKAFANQKQYWADFAYIWNSDKMKERRGGLKEDVAAAEVANAAANSKNKANAVISYLLKIGYTPTQMADSFAIASGGAPYYRNRIKSYQSEYSGAPGGSLVRTYTDAEAEALAWGDFTKVSDETQQSGDPRDISKQQASAAGRLLLTFQNTAMQQSRIVKKSFLDLKNGRGDTKTNVAKIVYYLGVQNVMFAALQQGLIAVGFGFGDDEEDEAKKKEKEKEKDKKIIDITNGVVDTILSGVGFYGKIAVTLKNMAKVYLDEKDKEFKADYAKVVLEGANISPPIGSKLRKLYSGLQQTKYDKDLIKERGWGVMQDGRVHLGPMYGISGKIVEATTNVPLDRLVGKIENASQAMNSQNEAWQRVMVGLGWNPYSIGIKGTKGDEIIEAKAKEVRAEEGLIKAEETREKTKDSISELPASERMRLKREERFKSRDNEIKRRERRSNRKMG